MAFLTTSTGALNPTASPLQRLPVAFSKKFLMRLEELNDEPFTKFVTEYPVPPNSGQTVVVTKTPTLAVATTYLAQDQTAKNTAYTSTNANLDLEFYGNDIGFSRLLEITSAFVESELFTAELAINARETMAQLVANDLDALSIGNSAASGSFAKLVTAVRTLKSVKVRGFRELNGHLVGVIGPFMFEDLTTEGSAAYKDHYQTPAGSDVLAEGELAKPIAGVQLFVSTVNKSLSTEELSYFWGEGAIGTVQLRAAAAGSDGKAITMPGVTSTLVGYLVPAQAVNAGDIYALYNHAVWRGGPLDYAVIDSTRAYVQKVSET